MSPPHLDRGWRCRRAAERLHGRSCQSKWRATHSRLSSHRRHGSPDRCRAAGSRRLNRCYSRRDGCSHHSLPCRDFPRPAWAARPSRGVRRIPARKGSFPRQARLWQPVLLRRKASAWPPPVPVLRCRLPSTGSMLLPAGSCLQYKSGFSFSSVILLAVLVVIRSGRSRRLFFLYPCIKPMPECFFRYRLQQKVVYAQPERMQGKIQLAAPDDARFREKRPQVLHCKFSGRFFIRIPSTEFPL